MTEKKEIDVLILCGGKGERLKAVVSDRPKPMAEFNSEPFLSVLMRYVSGFGFRRFILCTGHMGDVIKKYYSSARLPWEIVYSEEDKPFGTGGAIKKASRLIKSEDFLVMNGDSFCQLDLDRFLDFHLKKKALVSIALVSGDKDKNYGKVGLDSSQQITSFEEKADPLAGQFISSGVYFMSKDIFSSMEKREDFSLEYDIFPSVIKSMRCYGFKQDMAVVDFGTPVNYERAKKLFSDDKIFKKNSF
jgi:D-glycero-alpha-D-manno-heptose 1-phosphate guanylyltransferase